MAPLVDKGSVQAHLFTNRPVEIRARVLNVAEYVSNREMKTEHKGLSIMANGH